MADIDPEALRRVAEAATVGPWASDDPANEWRGRDGHVRTTHPDFEDCADEIAETLSNDDAQHIATFDPPTVLALLDRLAAAEGAVARVREVADKWDRWTSRGWDDVGSAQELRDALAPTATPQDAQEEA